MIKLNAGFSRKVGEPNYSSRGASVNLELEIAADLAQDPEGLMDRIRRLFQLARTAVDQELHNGTSGPNGRSDPPRSERPSNPDPSQGPRSSGRPATDSQLRAIRAIADRRHLDAESAARDHFGVGLNRLSLPEASTLIDALKARPMPEPAGRSR